MGLSAISILGLEVIFICFWGMIFFYMNVLWSITEKDVGCYQQQQNTVPTFSMCVIVNRTFTTIYIIDSDEIITINNSSTSTTMLVQDY